LDPGKQGYRINPTIGSHVDLLPTVLDILDVPLPTGHLYQGESLYRAGLDSERFIWLNSFSQYAVIAGSQFIRGERLTGQGQSGPGIQTVYTLANDGARTLFPETNAPVNTAYSIALFDSFQESLLRHYSYYSEIIHTSSPTPDPAAEGR
jgi:hypothetical protein